MGLLGERGVKAFGGRGLRFTGEETCDGFAKGRNEDIFRPVGILLGGLKEESLRETTDWSSIPCSLV